MAIPKIGNNVDPGSFLSYVSSPEAGGFQLPTRFSVNITRKNKDDAVFLCDMAQIPSYKIRTYSDFLSGTVSPLPTAFAKNVNTNIFQFIIEGSWASRKYFEDWQNSIFQTTGQQRSKVNYLEDYVGQIFILPLDNKTGINTYYRLDDCVPIEIPPAKLDATSLNTPLKFQVNILSSGYYTVT